MDYSNYLQMPELLNLQQPVSTYHKEELIFIVTHQAMELWLKVLLTEVKIFNSLCLNQVDYPLLIQAVDNCKCYWLTLLSQFNGIRALSPLDFMKFRDKLLHASGAQSQQYIQLEILLGLKSTSDEQTQTTMRFAATDYLRVKCSPDTLTRQYKTTPIIRLLVDKLIEFDELFMQWKSEHLRLVRRMIGNKMGTGDSHHTLLEKKVEHYIFPALWAMKDEL